MDIYIYKRKGVNCDVTNLMKLKKLTWQIINEAFSCTLTIPESFSVYLL